ncbi:hypothetical protein [Nocardioides sp.]|uniref:hypothetical protein n=1 Tax=Nocardioides sp. TaxID=35761 RepID=UPI002B268162|nr:hypothetical protein [Nocardioides sp.]
MTIFGTGQVITKREVWGGRVWLEHPVRVESDSAADVTDLLDRDERWWAPWDVWVPRPHH